MNWQEVFELLDEEIEKSTQKLIAEHPESEVHIYRRLKIKIDNRLKKEAKKHGEKR